MVDTDNPFSEDQQIEVLVDYFMDTYKIDSPKASMLATPIWKYLDSMQLEIRYK